MGKHRVASVLNYQLVRNKCNKFSVGGLIVFSVYVKSEEFVDVFDFAACPAYLNCMTNCAFDFARGRVEPFCNAGVKLLGDFADKLGFIIDHANSFAEKMVSLNMSGNADGEENGGDFSSRLLTAEGGAKPMSRSLTQVSSKSRILRYRNSGSTGLSMT